MDSLIVELDRAQDVLAVKGLTRPVTYTVKDVDVDLRCFPQFDGRQRPVPYRPAGPGRLVGPALLARIDLGGDDPGLGAASARARRHPSRRGRGPRPGHHRGARVRGRAQRTRPPADGGARRRPQVGHGQQGAGLQRPRGDDHEGAPSADRAGSGQRAAVRGGQQPRAARRGQQSRRGRLPWLPVRTARRRSSRRPRGHAAAGQPGGARLPPLEWPVAADPGS